jgi:hypothetical protein
MSSERPFRDAAPTIAPEDLGADPDALPEPPPEQPSDVPSQDVPAPEDA